MNYQIQSFTEYEKVYKYSIENPEAFWAEIAGNFQWQKPWDTVLDWNFKDPNIKWFEGGKLNITENCLDRHLETLGNKTAIIWEPNDPNEVSKNITYIELHAEVCRFANVLKNNGAKKGDRICIYMPMVPELAIAVLACARIGAIHSVVFGGFSAQSISDRIQDAQCNMVITADGAFRGAKQIPLKPIIDEALESCPSVNKVIVLARTQSEVNIITDRDVWWHDEIAKVNSYCPAEIMDAEDLLFILYTSGSTENQKAWCIPAVVIWCMQVILFPMCFNTNPMKFSFARRILAGLRDIAILFTGRWPMALLRSCLREFPTFPMPDGFGIL